MKKFMFAFATSCVLTSVLSLQALPTRGSKIPPFHQKYPYFFSQRVLPTMPPKPKPHTHFNVTPPRTYSQINHYRGTHNAPSQTIYRNHHQKNYGFCIFSSDELAQHLVTALRNMPSDITLRHIMLTSIFADFIYKYLVQHQVTAIAYPGNQSLSPCDITQDIAIKTSTGITVRPMLHNFPHDRYEILFFIDVKPENVSAVYHCYKRAPSTPLKIDEFALGNITGDEFILPSGNNNEKDSRVIRITIEKINHGKKDVYTRNSCSC